MCIRDRAIAYSEREREFTFTKTTVNQGYTNTYNLAVCMITVQQKMQAVSNAQSLQNRQDFIFLGRDHSRERKRGAKRKRRGEQLMGDER